MQERRSDWLRLDYWFYMFSGLYMQMLREEVAKPTLTKKEILFWFHRFRKLDTRKLEHRRRLIPNVRMTF